LKRDGLDVLERIFKILIKEKTKEDNWIKILNEREYIRNTIVKHIIESLRVIFEQFSTDSTLDIKDKAKTLLKILNSTQFEFNLN
jgi:hypothetical protein